MNPYFFGRSDQPLFGAYSPASAEPVGDGAVVLCYPIAQEYLRAHRAFRQLATELSRCGLHCLRFDYRASGDSAGDSGEADVDRWCEDIETAVRELKDVSGCQGLSLVGLRFGAALAAAVVHRGLPVRRLVLWDPVVDGGAYLDQLGAMDADMRRDVARFGPDNVRAAADAAFADQLLGFPFPQPMRASIRAVDLLRMPPHAAARVSLVASEARDEYAQLVAGWRQQGCTVDEHLAQGAAGWDDAGLINETLLASRAVQSICQELAGA